MALKQLVKIGFTTKTARHKCSIITSTQLLVSAQVRTEYFAVFEYLLVSSTFGLSDCIHLGLTGIRISHGIGYKT